MRIEEGKWKTCMWDETNRKYLIRLLDDPSDVVKEYLYGYFSSHEDEAAAFLRELARHSRGLVAYHAKQYLDRLGVDNTVEAFRQFIQSFSYELETGCWLLDRTIDPKADIIKAGEVLDEMGVRVLDLFVEPCSIKEKCRVINRVVFHEFGFCGDLDEYKQPRSSMVSRVLLSRRGIPLSLAIIYILVGMRCGVDLRPIAVPGRFMVGCYSEERPFFIDVFENGRFLTVADVLIFLETNRIDYHEGSLAPIPVGEVLCRSCKNLHHQFLATEDSRSAGLFSEFVDEFENAYKRAHRTL
jgi:regulator of sirC expression with transglutaminase-like and TPR domain